MPSRPLIQIFQDGSTVFSPRQGKYYSFRKFYSGQIDSTNLTKLQNKLSKEPLLEKNQFVETKGGLMIGLHGSVCYVKFVKGDDEIIVATDTIAKGGKFRELVNLAQKFLPKSADTFYPETLKVVVKRIDKPCEFESEYSKGNKIIIEKWMFGDKTSLEKASKSGKEPYIGEVEFNDPLIIRYIFNKSYFEDEDIDEWRFCENDVPYSIWLWAVPGWFGGEKQYEAFEAVRLMEDWEKANTKQR